jgi:hypothetical protein
LHVVEEEDGRSGSRYGEFDDHVDDIEREDRRPARRRNQEIQTRASDEYEATRGL